MQAHPHLLTLLPTYTLTESHTHTHTHSQKFRKLMNAMQTLVYDFSMLHLHVPTMTLGTQWLKKKIPKFKMRVEKRQGGWEGWSGKDLVCIPDLPPLEAFSGSSYKRTVSEPSRREFSSPSSVKRRIGISNRLVPARALSKQKGSPFFCLGFSLPFSSSHGLLRGGLTRCQQLPGSLEVR